jgi:hypothetical protein
MTEPINKRPKRNWVGLLVTTLLGIAATVAVGWYQLSKVEQQTILAEEERARAVRAELVSIVEEHVLNNQAIDLPRLTRLTDQRKREERVTTVISLSELLEKAEFNILGSRYLPFDRKQALKVVFDSAYSDLTTRAFSPYAADSPNAELFNNLAREIQGGKSTEAIQTLKRLQESYAKDVQDARAARRKPTLREALEEVFKNPGVPIAVLFLYITMVAWMMVRRPEIFHALRRLIGPRVSPKEARERIDRYRAAGMPDDIIVDRLWRQGVPRHWIFEILTESAAQMQSDEPTKETPPPGGV